MRTILSTTIALVAAGACGGPDRLPATPLSVTDHLLEAEQHDAEARQHDQQARAAEPGASAASAKACQDRVLADQAVSGGQRLGIQPCWASEEATVERHRASADRLRAHAAEHRAHAHDLLAAERAACAGLDPAEIDHSPFAHHEEIAAVAAELDGDRLRGARVRFAAVPGLSADWMRSALACHHARAAALGFDPTYLSDCPSTVAGAETTVLEQDGDLVVVVRAKDEAAALIIYARAEALLDGH